MYEPENEKVFVSTIHDCGIDNAEISSNKGLIANVEKELNALLAESEA